MLDSKKCIFFQVYWLKKYDYAKTRVHLLVYSMVYTYGIAQPRKPSISFTEISLEKKHLVGNGFLQGDQGWILIVLYRKKNFEGVKVNFFSNTFYFNMKII